MTLVTSIPIAIASTWLGTLSLVALIDFVDDRRQAEVDRLKLRIRELQHRLDDGADNIATLERIWARS